MLADIPDSLYLRVLSSPTFGRVVRAVIVLTSPDATPYGAVAIGAGTMVPVR